MDTLNTRTVQQEASECLAVQDAVNTGAIVSSFHRAFSTLWQEARRLGEGTLWVNRHPIVALYLHKLVSLAGSDRDMARDYQEVRMLATEPLRFPVVPEEVVPPREVEVPPIDIGDGPVSERFPKQAFVTPIAGEMQENVLEQQAIEETNREIETIRRENDDEPPLPNPFEPYEAI